MWDFPLVASGAFWIWGFGIRCAQSVTTSTSEEDAHKLRGILCFPEAYLLFIWRRNKVWQHQEENNTKTFPWFDALNPGFVRTAEKKIGHVSYSEEEQTVVLNFFPWAPFQNSSWVYTSTQNANFTERGGKNPNWQCFLKKKKNPWPALQEACPHSEPWCPGDATSHLWDLTLSSSPLIFKRRHFCDYCQKCFLVCLKHFYSKEIYLHVWLGWKVWEIHAKQKYIKLGCLKSQCHFFPEPRL